MDQGPGQEQAPPLAIGELAEGAIGDGIEIQLGQQLIAALPMAGADLLTAAQPYRAEETRNHHVAGDHAGAVGRLEIRGHQADAGAQVPEVHPLLAKDPQPGAGLHHRVDLAAEQFDQGTLARAVRPQDHGLLAQVQLQAEVGKNRPGPQVGLNRLEI